jgi:2-polyprenyl-3-methyl-5-hydroxy-6-metoxy-1,4-benzoquinol methylase
VPVPVPVPVPVLVLGRSLAPRFPPRAIRSRRIVEDADVETASAAYALRFSGAVGSWFLERQAALTLALLRPFPGARVVDVGGGHGQLAAPLASAGYDVTVYASAAEAASETVRHLAGTGGLAFRSGDLLQAPWPDHAFDVALCFRLLPHARDWRRLAGELSRLAAKAVIVDYPTRRSLNAVSNALFGLKRQVEGDTRPFTVFRDRDVVQAFAAHGLRPTARRGQFVLPMALHRALRSAVLARSLEAAAGAVGLRRALGSPVILRLEP